MQYVKTNRKENNVWWFKRNVILKDFENNNSIGMKYFLAIIVPELVN